MLCAGLTLLLTYAPRVAGITPLAVENNSLESKYPMGSVIYVQKTNPEDMAVGGEVTYIDENGGESTHIIKSIDLVSRTMVTTGTDINALDTQTVAFDNVIGKPIACIRYIGNVYGFCATRKMNIPVLVEIIVAIVVLSFFFGRIKNIARDNI
jgi:signal peptidase